MFLPAYTSGIVFLFVLIPVVNFASMVGDMHLFSFFNTSPFWYLFFIAYFIFLYLALVRSGLFGVVFIFFFLQFFFLSSYFSIECVYFLLTLNPLLVDSLNYLHPFILNTSYAFILGVVFYKYLFTSTSTNLRNLLVCLFGVFRLLFFFLT